LVEEISINVAHKKKKKKKKKFEKQKKKKKIQKKKKKKKKKSLRLLETKKNYIFEDKYLTLTKSKNILMK